MAIFVLFLFLFEMKGFSQPQVQSGIGLMVLVCDDDVTSTIRMVSSTIIENDPRLFLSFTILNILSSYCNNDRVQKH